MYLPVLQGVYNYCAARPSQVLATHLEMRRDLQSVYVDSNRILLEFP